MKAKTTSLSRHARFLLTIPVLSSVLAAAEFPQTLRSCNEWTSWNARNRIAKSSREPNRQM